MARFFSVGLCLLAFLGTVTVPSTPATIASRGIRFLGSVTRAWVEPRGRHNPINPSPIYYVPHKQRKQP